MNGLFSNIRFYVLLFSAFLIAAVYFQTKATVEGEALQNIRLVQYYALIAVGYLYVTLLASPVTRLFTFLPSGFRGRYLKARRALGVSAFIFALLHASLAFFGQLGGFAGLPFLPFDYLVSIGLGATSLFILTLMALTASEYMVEKLSFPRWKNLHRLVYLVGILTVIHALRLGTHFQDLSDTIPAIFSVALSILLILEAIRFDAYLQNRFQIPPKYGLFLIIFSLSLGGAYIYFLAPSNSNRPYFGIHSQHIQLAQEAQNFNNNLPNFPGLQGDRTKRYTASLLTPPQNIIPGQETKVGFKIYDASSGNEIKLFNKVYEKNMHLIIVNSELNSFDHVHPDLSQEGFFLPYTFQKPGLYHLYTSFQPVGAIEQQIGFSLNVGNVTEPVFSKSPVDTNLSKQFGDFKVSLSFPKPLNATELSLGKQLLKFTITDLNNNPVTNLKPYLAAFGHLVMINQETFDYLHIHPNSLVVPKPDEISGPDVEFMPLGIYGPIKPGVYRVFAQFNPDGKLFTSDFTVEVQ